MIRSTAVCSVALLLAAASCESTSVDVIDEAGDGTGGSDVDDPVDAGDGAEDPSDGGAPEADEAEPARGITVQRVEANPGVAIPIAENGRWVDGSQRQAQIPKNRNTAFRVYVDVDESVWVQREIEGRLTIVAEDGSETTFSETIEISGDSAETSLQSNFLFGVFAESMQPGARFRVELFEAGGDYESLPPADSPPTAVDEDALIGVEPSDQTIRLVMVPVSYDFGGCTTEIDTSEASMGRYEDALFQQNGVESVEMTIREPLRVDDLDLASPDGFFTFLNRMVQLRAQEAPAPNVYYYGLFDNCGQCIGDGGCLLGVAPGLAGSGQGDAGMRVSIGTQFLGGSEVGIETFVHEVGHNQGRAHVACPGGGAAGPDISYPYPDGAIGVWGFGVRDFQVRNANVHADYMSYCNPTWVSDWQWRATFERIRELSSWDAANVAPDDDARILVGAVNTETGESQWWTDRGWIEPDDVASDAALRLLEGGEVVDELGVDVDAWSEGPWVTVRAPLNRALEFSSFELSTASARIEVQTDRVARLVAPVAPQ